MLGSYNQFKETLVFEDISKMLSSQLPQKKGGFMLVLDASLDPNIEFESTQNLRQAFYLFKGVRNKSIDDYQLISAPYSGGNSGSVVFEKDIIVSLASGTFGQFKNGDIIPAAGKTANEVIIMATQVIQNPTFVAPTMNTTSSISGTREVGETVQVALTSSFNRGRINGKMNSGVWEPSTKQNDRAGAVDYYSFLGVNNGAVNTKTVEHITILGSNTFATAVGYLAGPQPLNSNGENYSTQLPAGELTRTVTFTGALKRFFGPTAALANPRDLPSIFNNISDATTFDLMTGTTDNIFHILLPVGKVLDSVLSVEAFNLDITDEYILQPSIQIPDANGDNHTYNHYKMTGDSPYGTNSTHRIKVKNG